MRHRGTFSSFGMLLVLLGAPSLAAAQVPADTTQQPTAEPPASDNRMVEEPAQPAPASAVTPAPAPTPATTAAHATPEPADAAATHSAAHPTHPDEDDDDGDRTRHFWMDFSAGYSWINMVALDQSGLVPEPTQQRSSGIVGELGLGFQVSVLRAGVAGSYSRYAGFDVVTAELDVAVVIPIPVVQPYIEVGIGYGAIRNVTETNTMGRVVTVPIHGIAIDAGLGIDINVSDVVQFGIGAEASFLNLQRQSVTNVGTIGNVDFSKPGNSVGLQVHGVGRITFQF